MSEQFRILKTFVQSALPLHVQEVG
jgi:hypothetical protein